MPSDVLGEAITPLRRRRVAEPELLLCGVAALHLAALESKDALDRRRCCVGGVHDPPHVLFRRRPRHANPLVVVDELVRELAKEFKAAYHLVVRMDHLLEKKVGIDADDAEDSEVEPLVPISGGEIADHPQFVGADPVVPVDGAGTLVICRDRLWLGNLDNDRVRWRTTGLVQMAETLTEDVLPLSDSARRHHEKSSIPIDPTDGNEFRLASLLVN